MSERNNHSFGIRHVRGQQLLTQVPQAWRSANGRSVCIPGSHGDPSVYLNEDTMSKHILALGSIGSGKSTLLYHVVRGILSWNSPNDRYIFFDAKGDYIRQFRNPNTSVSIGYDGEYRSEAWNLFADIMDSPAAAPDMELLRQIATTLFKRQIDASNNPTFVFGARDLFVGLVKIFINRCQRAGQTSWQYMNNAELKKFFMENARDGQVISNMVSEDPSLAWLTTYLLAPTSATTQSYLAPLQTMMNDVFVGCFARNGSFSIRQFMRSNTGKRELFLEYDPEKGCIIDTVYTALLDLAIKEAIGRQVSGRNVFFVLDEFPMIPPLTYISQALQFGRSLGVKVIAAIQNTSQMMQKYGEDEAMNIISGFSTVLAFRLFDQRSRDIISGRHGKRIVRINCASSRYNEQDIEEMRDMDVVADWDVTCLQTGQCVVSPYMGDPFLFFPDMYPIGLPAPAPVTTQPTGGSNKHIRIIRGG